MSKHDHDLDYAVRHHRHFDLDREVEELRRQVRDLRAILIEFGLDLSEVQGRIHQLEGQGDSSRPGTGNPADGFACNCARRLPWPSEAEDVTCPGCGVIWEASTVGGARVKHDPGGPVMRDGTAHIVNGDGR